jgi:hypothetical protein
MAHVPTVAKVHCLTRNPEPRPQYRALGVESMFGRHKKLYAEGAQTEGLVVKLIDDDQNRIWYHVVESNAESTSRRRHNPSG